MSLNSSNPKDIIGASKPPLAYVPPALLIHTAQAMKDGAAKYNPYNWRENKVSAMTYLHAALRHILALVDGENLAEDSRCHHAGHAAACLGIFLDAQETGNLLDDRPHSGCASQLLKRFTEQKKDGAPVSYLRPAGETAPEEDDPTAFLDPPF